MKTVFFLIAISLSCFRAGATNYYLSQNGSDDNKGTDQRSPWRTLSMLDAVSGTLKAGDSILLERGSMFFGGLSLHADGAPRSNVYIGAYGKGPRPIITGSKQVGKWTRYSKNIWVATCAECAAGPMSVFVDGKYHAPGRYPNADFRSIGKSLNSERAFADPALSFPDNFWDGAEVVVKSSRWTLDKLHVYRYANNAFEFADRASDTLQSGYGYFIQNHLSTLDQDGEWFLDTETHQLFLYGEKSVPGTIEVSASNAGFTMVDSRNVLIENLSIRNQRLVGVSVTRSDDVVLRNVDITHAGANSLVVVDCHNPLVQNIRIADSGNNGVEWGNNDNGRFLNNTIIRTGLNAGCGASGNGNYIALSIQSSYPRLANLIANNRIDSVGYIGIDFRSGNTTLKNNFISDFCLLKDDGAGIYTWGNAYGGNVIDGNIIMNGKGSGTGTPDASQLYTSGIYIDDRSAHIEITQNTVAFNATAGIMIHNSNNITIRGNRLYGNGSNLPNIEKAQLFLKRDALVPLRSRDPLELTIVDNIFLATDESTPCLYLSAKKEQDLKNDGLVGNNTYISASPRQAIATATDDAVSCSGPQTWTVADWQKRTSLDSGSVFKILPGGALHRRGKNLVRNSTMTNGLSGWIIWPETAMAELDKTLAGSSCLKAQPPLRGSALLYHSGFSLNPSQAYRLSFRAKSVAANSLEFAALEAAAPWGTLGRPACFSLDTAFRTFTYYFKPDKASADARVNFKSDAIFWIDDVTLQEVLPFRDHEQSLKLICNTTDSLRIFALSEMYRDLDGEPVCGEVSIAAYDSMVLFNDK